MIKFNVLEIILNGYYTKWHLCQIVIMSTTVCQTTLCHYLWRAVKVISGLTAGGNLCKNFLEELYEESLSYFRKFTYKFQGVQFKISFAIPGYPDAQKNKNQKTKGSLRLDIFLFSYKMVQFCGLYLNYL